MVSIGASDIEAVAPFGPRTVFPNTFHQQMHVQTKGNWEERGKEPCKLQAPCWEPFHVLNDEYTNRIPKYTKVKVLCTQDKHGISWAASQSYAAAAAL